VLRLRQAGEDPALLATFQSLFASFRPSSIAPSEKRTSCEDAIFINP
jgi:hypothetical protein